MVTSFGFHTSCVFHLRGLVHTIHSCKNTLLDCLPNSHPAQTVCMPATFDLGRLVLRGFTTIDKETSPACSKYVKTPPIYPVSTDYFYIKICHSSLLRPSLYLNDSISYP